jgi:transcription elongation factor Elf1
MRFTNKDVVIAVDNNVPVVFGECTYCKSGNRSLVIVDFVPSKLHNTNSIVYLKCISCDSVYQTNVKDVSKSR